MNYAIEKNRVELAELCARYRVRRLEVFGSASGPGFDSERSDLDFLVDFLPLEPGCHADAYFGLLEELQMLFGRRVELVMERAIRNPYFLEGIANSRETLYAT